MLFFEAHAGRGQVGGVDQSDRAFPPGIGLNQRREQMLIDAPQSRHTQAVPELVQHAHARHLALAAQLRKLPPGALLRQHFDQEVQRMDRGEQTQQMHPIELSGGVFSMSATRVTGGPTLIDEIVGNERSQQFEQFSRAGRRKMGVHGPQPMFGHLTRQQQWPDVRFSAYFTKSDLVAETFATPSYTLAAANAAWTIHRCNENLPASANTIFKLRRQIST